MPAQFTLPPDTRSVGSGNPPADMNGVVDALAATGIAGNVLNAAYSGGADPAGIADSTAAAAAAITAAGVNGTVTFPAGTYLINTGPLTPLSGQTWNGPGTLKLGASAGSGTAGDIVYAASAVTGLTFRGLTFDGNQANQTVAGTALVQLVSPSNCVIENCTFQNSYGAASYVGTAGVQLRMPQNCRIRSCYISNCGYGIALGSLNTDSVPMYGNSVTDCDINTTNWDGIFLTENLGSVTSITPAGYLRGTVVANCRFQEVGDAAVEVGSGNIGTVVSGCTMDNTVNTAVGNNGIIIRDSQDISITGCTIRNYLKSASCGIYMLNLNGTGGNGKNDQNISITGCVIDTADYGIIDGAGVTGLAITGCYLNKFSQTSAGSAGVKLSGTSTFTVTGTTLANGSGTPGSNEGLEMITCHDGTVTGCNFFNNRGNDAFIVNSTSYDIVISGNRFGPSNTGHALRIFDAGSYNIQVLDNDFNGNTTGGTVTLNATPGPNIAISLYAGYTASGAPSAGTYVLGNWVTDQAGAIWICTAAGTPGTWKQAGAPPLTTAGDLLIENATPAPARLAVGTAGQVLGVTSGLPAWGMGMTLLATTGTSGYTLVNSTGNIITWTAPSDGNLHRVTVFAMIAVATTEVGGQISVTYTAPNGTGPNSSQIYAAALATGARAGSDYGLIIEAGSTVSVQQVTALSGGAAVFWGEIWGS